MSKVILNQRGDKYFRNCLREQGCSAPPPVMPFPTKNTMASPASSSIMANQDTDIGWWAYMRWALLIIQQGILVQ